MEFIIRKATERDREDFIKILKIWNLHIAFLKDEDRIDYTNFYVAESNFRVIGVAGFEKVTSEKYRTRFLALYPEFQGLDLGKKLQEKRLAQIYQLGGRIVETLTDRNYNILWYKKHFGYKEVGVKKKEYEYCLKDKDYMIILELDLKQYMTNKEKINREKNEYISANHPHPLSSYPPLIINVALTGVIPTKLFNPYTPNQTSEAYNKISHSSTFTQNDKEKTINDVWFFQNKQNTTYDYDKEINQEIQDLPNLKGSGRVMDLHHAMNEDDSLHVKVQTLLDNASDMTFSQFNKEYKEVLARWSKTDHISPNTTRGVQYLQDHTYSHPYNKRVHEIYAYARDVAILEAFGGKTYSMEINGQVTTDVIGTEASVAITKSLEELQRGQMVELLANSMYKEDVYQDGVFKKELVLSELETRQYIA